jgi:aspartate dehydrogenase
MTGDVKTVAIGGLGAIGMRAAQAVDAGIDGLRLTAVSARDIAAAKERVGGFKNPPEVLPLGELAAKADIVVECAPAAFFDEIAEPSVDQGRIFLPCSCGRLVERGHLIERAKETGARIIVPTGALVGFDAVRAAAEGTINEVRMITWKPPGGIHGAPYIDEHNIDLSNLTEPMKVFEGTVREAAAGFPANLNVAAALSMAALGPDKTIIELWADPGRTRNEHLIVVDSDASHFEIKIAGIPSPDNPATGLLTPLSVIATLRGLVSHFKVGS